MTWKDDADVIDPQTVENVGPAYPMAQWLNGDPKLAAVGGVVHTGGVILPRKYVDDAVAPPAGWTQANVAFSSGKTEPVFEAHKPVLAVIRMRFRWFVTYNGVTTFYPRSGYVADSGMRGHIQALCGVRGFDFPIVLTFKGKASQEFEKLVRDFTQKTQDATRGEKKFPRFAFYLKLAPGAHQKVGQKGQESIITPPTLELPDISSHERLEKIYVGRDVLVAYQEHYRAASEWAAAWERPGAEESEAPETRNAHIDTETGEVTADVGPLDVWTEAQALGAFKAAGLKDSDLKNALQKTTGAFKYDPVRDTALARQMVSAAIQAF